MNAPVVPAPRVDIEKEEPIEATDRKDKDELRANILNMEVEK
jgi:hypothetical protein